MDDMTGPSAQGLPEEPDLEDVAREYPGWRVWTGTDRRYHALRKCGPPLTVRGDYPLDLADEIRRAEAFIAEL